MNVDPLVAKPLRNFKSKIVISNNIYCIFRPRQSLNPPLQNKKSIAQFQLLCKTDQSYEKDSLPSPLNQQVKNHSENNPFIITTNWASLNRGKCQNCKKQFRIKGFQKIGLCDDCQQNQQLYGHQNFVNFFRYILDFKMGNAQSYARRNKLLRIQSIESCQSFTQDKISQSGIKNSIHNVGNFGARLFNSKPLTSLQNFNKTNKKIDEVQQEGETQGGYFCDGCGAQPIVGRRYNCKTCLDYDLCQKCYFYLGHNHVMQTIFERGRKRQMQKFSQALLKTSENLSKAIPHLSHSIRDLENLPKLYQTAHLGLS